MAKKLTRCICLMSVVFFGQSSLAFGATVQQQIRLVVEQFVVESFTQEFADFNPDQLFVQYDPAITQLKQRPCPETPQISATGNLPLGRKNLKLVCPVANGWQLYAPVRVVYEMEVIVTATDVDNGATIHDHQLILATRDIGKLKQGYFTAFESVAGYASRRHLRPGTVITANLLQAPLLIEKGDQVVIVAKKGGLEVRVSGVALTRGRLGKQIPVRNSKTKRIVRGKVVASGVVEVML